MEGCPMTRPASTTEGKKERVHDCHIRRRGATETCEEIVRRRGGCIDCHTSRIGLCEKHDGASMVPRS